MRIQWLLRNEFEKWTSYSTKEFLYLFFSRNFICALNSDWNSSASEVREYKLPVRSSGVKFLIKFSSFICLITRVTFVILILVSLLISLGVQEIERSKLYILQRFDPLSTNESLWCLSIIVFFNPITSFTQIILLHKLQISYHCEIT